ncbi:hypothetical protein MAPG_02098 [Magnaporthiopsis poae ATCC 64411]|uniref:Uncharacterized protein n=1 Tax=Magnaporthiopsis poae (strain ATCC 64411 / 73-15) TaxID=644358 RepID=A0A0C4DQF8_MAGP6|nr:hypothetical protein MAPG_02098 [Magnaporthiopsis poae ATCC 64411]
MSDQHNTGPGPPYDEEADQPAEHSYTTANPYTDGTVVPFIPPTSAPDGQQQQQQLYGHGLDASSSSYTQGQSSLSSGAEAAGAPEPTWEGRFQTEAMPEDFSYLLHTDNKYYCNVEGCNSAGKEFDIPTNIR